VDDQVARLIHELRRCAGWEDLGGAIAAARELAARDSDAAVAALVSLLEDLDRVDLSDDAGDVGDEVWRTREALRHGLEACGRRSLVPLRSLVTRPPSPSGQVALLVLAKLGDDFAAPIAIDWVSQGVSAALLPLGLLAPPGAVAVLARAIDHAGDDSWTKRLAAHALGAIDTDAALDVLEQLLEDREWFARLGAAEALRELAGDRARRLLERARRDVDPRVVAAAG